MTKQKESTKKRIEAKQFEKNEEKEIKIKLNDTNWNKMKLNEIKEIF